MYTALALYNNASTEIAGALDSKYNLSSEEYMTSSIDYWEELYAVQFSRLCNYNSNAFCVEVPTEDEFPVGANFFMIARAYLNPKSKTSPDPYEILLPRLIQFTRTK